LLPSRSLLDIALSILTVQHLGYATDGEAAGGEMNGYEPCAGEVDQVMQLIRVRDAVDSGVQSEEEEEDVRDIFPST
jgi:hypothetical protein